MIIGAMKSGTTTLYQYLGRHPRVFMCTPKEPMFFSREAVRARGLDWYFSLFRDARDDQICGEASTCYTRWPFFGDVAARIRDACPDGKFIYVMRHPVERTYSHYRHEMEERQVHGTGKLVTFEAALEEEPVIFEASLYRRQIGKFLDYFPRDRFLLLFFEDLAHNPGPVLSAVQRFLCLEETDSLLTSKVAANPFGSVRSKIDRLSILEFARRIPGARTLSKFMPAGTRAWLRSSLVSYSPVAIAMRFRIRSLERRLTPLDDAMRKKLLQRFSVANGELQQLMGRPVPPSWNE